MVDMKWVEEFLEEYNKHDFIDGDLIDYDEMAEEEQIRRMHELGLKY